MCIHPTSHVELSRPSHTHRKNREIIFSLHADDLPARIEKKEYRMASKTPVGLLHGKTYHIVQIDGILTMLDKRHWKQFCNKTFSGHDSSTIGTHPIDFNNVALIRQGNSIHEQELGAIKKRLKKAKNCLESALKRPFQDNQVPRIALCLSGGGMRAAMCSLGLLKGLNVIGILDAVIWAATLSGSSWLISHYCHYNKSINDYNNLFFTVADSNGLLSIQTIRELLNSNCNNVTGNTLIDYYGAYLAHKFFTNIPSAQQRQQILFSDLKTLLDDGQSIIPLSTAVEITYSRHNPAWFTFTPYEIGSDQLGLHVPTQAFGRKFFNGVSTNNCPEKSLGYFMGLWGSAMSGTVKQIFDHGIKAQEKYQQLYDFCKKIIKETIGSVTFAPIKVSNPFYGIESSIYKNLSHLNFVDAGYHFNIPLPPLLNPERAIDIIIILDASRKVQYKEGAQALHKAYDYVVQEGLPFPKIEHNNVRKNEINVFFDPENPKVPLIIYIPVFKNKSHPEFPDPEVEFFTTYNTGNFSYPKHMCQRLIDLVACNVFDNKDLILDAIKLKIDQKQNSSLD